jgi:hypothetical protein
MQISDVQMIINYTFKICTFRICTSAHLISGFRPVVTMQVLAYLLVMQFGCYGR